MDTLEASAPPQELVENEEQPGLQRQLFPALGGDARFNVLFCNAIFCGMLAGMLFMLTYECATDNPVCFNSTLCRGEPPCCIPYVPSGAACSCNAAASTPVYTVCGDYKTRVFLFVLVLLIAIFCATAAAQRELELQRAENAERAPLVAGV